MLDKKNIYRINIKKFDFMFEKSYSKYYLGYKIFLFFHLFNPKLLI